MVKWVSLRDLRLFFFRKPLTGNALLEIAAVEALVQQLSKLSQLHQGYFADASMRIIGRGWAAWA
jgi:hypothetical protein